MSTANLAIPLRDAIVGNSGISILLPVYLGGVPVFTGLPVPADAPYPMITVSPDIAVTNEDGLFDFRPIAIRNIGIYARNDTAEHARLADTLGYLIRDLFHRQRQAITVPSWNVVDIQALGPAQLATDDQIEARVVTLAVRLAQVRI